VSQAANALTDLGVVAGDRVAIYMPMVPEAIVAMLACARLGVMHSVVFAGYSAPALRARIEDAEAKLVITTDGQYRRGKAVSLKESVDEAVRPGTDDEKSPVQHVLVVRRTGIDVPWTEGRDLWWHDTVENASPEHTPEAFDAEHPLFLLYTSGTTGARRASCTPPVATSPRRPTRTTASSTSSRKPTCTGAPPTSVGSPGTPTSSTGRCPTG
jgi:acetyl-CoA synthetase